MAKHDPLFRVTGQLRIGNAEWDIGASTPMAKRGRFPSADAIEAVFRDATQPVEEAMDRFTWDLTAIDPPDVGLCGRCGGQRDRRKRRGGWKKCANCGNRDRAYDVKAGKVTGG